MSIWSELLFLHGHLTRPPEAPGSKLGDTRANAKFDADRLRALLGCRPAASRDTDPRGPLLGVRGLC
ncbi:MAG TPA: hypothetical protein VLQ79_03150 [Myxococcaceae bacterium]|nr:hypothetical protein [Myxococcaceae bacterium]